MKFKTGQVYNLEWNQELVSDNVCLYYMHQSYSVCFSLCIYIFFTFISFISLNKILVGQYAQDNKNQKISHNRQYYGMEHHIKLFQMIIDILAVQVVVNLRPQMDMKVRWSLDPVVS